ncbi:MAG: sigma-70 family RNA polymerase sigma factor [Marinirhabdus sp.]|nr:sigma-70 family RNA polymerase sigma factor [Marinirhabdus sp.]
MTKELFTDVCNTVVFAKLYRKYSQSLHDFLYYKYGAGANAGDLTQEAFVSLWEACKQVTPDKAKSYLFTVANNKMLNDIKHQKVVLKYQKLPSKSHTNESPEFVLRQNEFMEQYRNALVNLTEEQRVAFSMSKIEGKKHREIAEILGVTQKVVEYRIYSAFDALRKQLENFNI